MLDAVRAAGAFLIEDDAFRDTRVRPGPAAAVHRRSRRPRRARPLAHQAVLARPADRRPDRPRPGRARLRAARIVEDLFVAGPLQEAALELVGTPAWRAHLRRLRRVLRERRDALAAHFTPRPPPRGRHEPVGPASPGTDDRDLAQRAAAAGVIVSPGPPVLRRRADRPVPARSRRLAAERRSALPRSAPRRRALLALTLIANGSGPPRAARIRLGARAGHASGRPRWETSVFPDSKSSSYVLPSKPRHAGASVEDGDTVTVASSSLNDDERRRVVGLQHLSRCMS